MDKDKCILVADGHFVTTKIIRQFKIEMRDENGKPIIATLYKVLLAPDLCDWLFSINMLMNLGHTCIFQKGFCTVSFSDNKQTAVRLPHSALIKNAFLVKTKEKSKSKKKTLKGKLFWNDWIRY